LEKFDFDLFVASSMEEIEGTQSGETSELVDEMGLVVVAAAERQIRPPHLGGGVDVLVRMAIEIRFSLRIREKDLAGPADGPLRGPSGSG